MGEKAKYPVQATETSLRIIDTLQEFGTAGVTELAEELDIAPSAVHKHLSTLHQHRYVAKEDDSKYRIGLRFLAMGGHTRHQLDLYNIAKPKLKSLSEETGERTNLLVEENGHGIYLYRSLGNEELQINTYIGQETHLHYTALGKVILANFTETRVNEIIERHGLPSMTEETITDKESLMEELAKIRENGIAFDNEERIKGLRCVASPVFDDEENVIGAISVSGPKSRMDDERFKTEIPASLSQKVNLIELNLSY